MSTSILPASSSLPAFRTPYTTRIVKAEFMSLLEAGRIYEDFTVHIVNKNNRYTTVERPPGNFPDYDAKFLRNTPSGLRMLTTETKLDALALKYRNMCVEFETIGKPMNSGINATKALVWVHILHNYDPRSTEVEYLYIPTAKLREYIAETTPYSKWGGTNSYSHFYLIPLLEMEKYRRSVPISSLPPELVQRIRSIPRFLVTN